MTDQTTETVKSEEETSSIFDLEDRDWLLALLVNLANQKVGIGITLQVGGVTISGELASGVAYLAWISAEMTRASKGAFQASDFKLGDVIPTANEIYDEKTGSLYKGTPTYVHLRNAKIHAPGQPPLTKHGVWWRGRLSEVSGFSLGELLPAA